MEKDRVLSHQPERSVTSTDAAATVGCCLGALRGHMEKRGFKALGKILTALTRVDGKLTHRWNILWNEDEVLVVAASLKSEQQARDKSGGPPRLRLCDVKSATNYEMDILAGHRVDVLMHRETRERLREQLDSAPVDVRDIDFLASRAGERRRRGQTLGQTTMILQEAARRK